MFILHLSHFDTVLFYCFYFCKYRYCHFDTSLSIYLLMYLFCKCMYMYCIVLLNKSYD